VFVCIDSLIIALLFHISLAFADGCVLQKLMLCCFAIAKKHPCALCRALSSFFIFQAGCNFAGATVIILNNRITHGNNSKSTATGKNMTLWQDQNSMTGEGRSISHMHTVYRAHDKVGEQKYTSLRVYEGSPVG